MPIVDHDQHITLPEAAAMTQRFRQANPIGTIIGHMFSREIIDEILAQPGCEGIRIYNAIDDSNVMTLVVTGVDINKNDLFNGPLAEYTEKCPSICSPNNPLNS